MVGTLSVKTLCRTQWVQAPFMHAVLLWRNTDTQAVPHKYPELHLKDS